MNIEKFMTLVKYCMTTKLPFRLTPDEIGAGYTIWVDGKFYYSIEKALEYYQL